MDDFPANHRRIDSPGNRSSSSERSGGCTASVAAPGAAGPQGNPTGYIFRVPIAEHPVQRRDFIRLLGGASIITGLDVDQLLALGRRTHRNLAAERSPLGFFDQHQMHTVAAAGERILPATDTPGAFAAECHRFTERIVAHHYAPDRQKRFQGGLVDLDARSRSVGGKLFVELDDASQDQVLAAIEADAYAAEPNGTDSFWRDLKYLTLYGYYTSEIGIEEELRTNRFPGSYQGAAEIAR